MSVFGNVDVRRASKAAAERAAERVRGWDWRGRVVVRAAIETSESACAGGGGAVTY